MHKIEQLPNKEIKSPSSIISGQFIELGIRNFHEACRWVKELPYGYNSSHDDPSIIFVEKRVLDIDPKEMQRKT